MRYRRHGISEELDWKTSLVLERFSNLWTESGIPTSDFENLYFNSLWREDRLLCRDLRAYLDQREFYSRVCMEEFLNLDEVYDIFA